MIRRLIDRPVAVTMVVVAILALGIIAAGILPVSLMPEVDIPRITIQCSAPGSSAREIDRTIIRPLRTQLVQTTSLKDMECSARNGGGTITLEFEHGTKIDYVFIEVNEKIDRAMNSLPDGLERPKVIKASATEIPVFFIDVMSGSDDDDETFIGLSSFSDEVIRKRLEQIPQIAMVDVSGTLGYTIVIEPYPDKLQAIGKTSDFIAGILEDNNIRLGSLNIRDGYYRWSVAFDKEIRTDEDIRKIVVNADGRIFPITELASIKTVPADATGIVRSDGRRAVTLAVIKQADARMSDLKESIEEMLDIFAKDYPEIDFKVTRNQTELLEYSIDNLKSNIIIGAILAVLIIFLFLKDFKSPVLVTITIPLSLVVTMLLLYLLGISINIISLSGLILGIGMMVDNSIIVIDNITQYRERGMELKEAAVKGTAEVVAPMLSSVLTTCSVFLPLIFLSGIAGALFYDQAMGVTVGLFASLAVAVLIIPVYYVLLYGEKIRKNREERKTKRFRAGFLQKDKDLVNYDAIYEKGLKWFFRHPFTAWTAFFLFIPLTVLLFWKIDKSQLPPMTRDDTLITIDWNEPVSVEENDRRIAGFLENFDEQALYTGIMSGPQDFILSHTDELGSSQTQVYLEIEDPERITDVEQAFKDRLTELYPAASLEFSLSSNIFNIIFSGEKADIVARISTREGNVPGPDELNAFIDTLRKELPSIHFEPVVWEEQIIMMADYEKMALYGIEYESVYSALSKALGRNEVMNLKDGSMSVPVLLTDGIRNGYLLERTVKGHMTDTSGNIKEIDVPLNEILKERRTRDLKNISSGKDGEFYPLEISLAGGHDAHKVMAVLEDVAKRTGDYHVFFTGGWFESRALIKELAFVMLISLLLLFFILAAQFESLVQPFIILSEIVVDMFGALFLLWILGAGINLMSLIGLVVMSGIIINDSILKVDTINRLRRNGLGLLRAILTAGKRRLKPILMTSLTTILAIAPFLVRGDMGSDLQFPLSVALIGGMLLGTLVSIFYIPLLYYEIYRRGERLSKMKEDM